MENDVNLKVHELLSIHDRNELKNKLHEILTDRLSLKKKLDAALKENVELKEASDHFEGGIKEMFSSEACEQHQEMIRAIGLPSFMELNKRIGCKYCLAKIESV